MTVSLGIEIEVPWEAVFDHVPWTITHREYARLRAERILPFEQATALGVPPGKPDGEPTFWEFALDATYESQVLLDQVAQLYAQGTLRTDYQRYPLHLTIGGLTCTGSDRYEVNLLTRALEATAWVTTPERLLQPVSCSRRRWASRTASGIRHRPPGDPKLQLGATTAVELRTFWLIGLEGLQNVLSAAQCLASRLQAYQQGCCPYGAPWMNVVTNVRELFLAHKLADPYGWWQGTSRDPEQNPFFGLAAALRRPEFVSEAQSLVIDYTEVKHG